MSTRPIWPDMIGKTYGRLTVLRPEKKYGATCLVCMCSCGNTTTQQPSAIMRGRIKGCGCDKNQSHIKHGHTIDGSKTREYACWQAMRTRCENKNLLSYQYYGARGITVCQRWRDSFENFYADMGPRPSPKHSIDRKDNDGNYEPSNCRWATKKEQIHNRRRNGTAIKSTVEQKSAVR